MPRDVAIRPRTRRLPGTVTHGNAGCVMGTLQELLECVEKAEGPNVELDHLIWWHFYCPENGKDDAMRVAPKENTAYRAAWARCFYGEHRDTRFSASIDAAVALVEKMLPGCWLDLAGPRKYLHIPTPSPNYWRGMVDGWDAHGDVVGWGANPALALIAALLRALIAKEAA